MTAAELTTPLGQSLHASCLFRVYAEIQRDGVDHPLSAALRPAT